MCINWIIIIYMDSPQDIIYLKVKKNVLNLFFLYICKIYCPKFYSVFYDATDKRKIIGQYTH